MTLIDPMLKALFPSPPRHLEPFVLPGPTILDGIFELRDRLLEAGE